MLSGTVSESFECGKVVFRTVVGDMEQLCNENAAEWALFVTAPTRQAFGISRKCVNVCKPVVVEVSKLWPWLGT